MTKKKEPINLVGIQNRIKSDRSITTEEEAREKFWTPTNPNLVDNKEENIFNKSIHNHDVEELDISKIFPDPNQPRKKFNQITLEELANSIAERGVLNPIIVRKVPEGYKLIAGERRWRASKSIGKTHILAIVKEVNDAAAFAEALTENIQRDDLHYIDESEAYKLALEKKYFASQSDLAEKLGVQRSRVSERMKLQQLPAEVKEMAYQSDAISISHAIRLAQVEDKDFCRVLAAKIMKDNLSVKKLDQLMTKKKKDPDRHKASFRAVHIRKKATGFDLAVKYRTDRPEDKALIVEHLRKIITDLEGNVPTLEQ